MPSIFSFLASSLRGDLSPFQWQRIYAQSACIDGGSTLQLFHILVSQIESREVAGLASLRPYKSTTILGTLKIPLALDRSVIFARGLIERNPHPDANTGNLGHHTDIRDCASASVRVGKEAHPA
jgi:hypothetical protein